MLFKLIFNIKESGLTKEIHDINLKNYAYLGLGESSIENENYIVDILINDIKQIQNLGYYFDRDIKICGDGMNILEVIYC